MSVSGFWNSRSVQPLVSERLTLPQGDSRAQPFRTGLGTGRRAGGSSYGLDGTILGLPGGPVHLEIVRLGDAPQPARGLDQLVFYLPDAAAQERITARLAAAGVHPVAQIDHWQANGGVTYQDPDGRDVMFASWMYGPPKS